MLAYHSDPAIKTAIMRQLAGHRAADEIIKGQCWEDGKGCAVGCTIHSGSHAEYEPRFGIPQILARLEDRIFEGLPNGTAKAWPERFMGAIRPGSDLSMIWPRFALWLLSEELPPLTAKHPRCTKALADVAALYREWINSGKNPARAKWEKARKNAYAYAASAAYATADAASAYAAYATAASAYAAYATDAAYTDAAYADAAYADAAYAYAAYADAAYAYAAYATAASAYAAYATAASAREKAFIRQADKLVELLVAAP